MADMLKLKAEDGHEFGAYLAQPSGKPRGGIVVIQEIFGVNSHIRAIADGYAKDGYLAIAPALFDRIQPGIELGYDEDDVTKGRELKGQSSNDAALLDIKASADAVRSAGQVVAVGYCWGRRAGVADGHKDRKHRGGGLLLRRRHRRVRERAAEMPGDPALR